MTNALLITAFWRDRMRASAIHLGISLSIAALAALLVFGLWYPYPYREVSGGRELFFLIVTVDVLLGPLITLAVFNRKKPLTDLRRDLAMVGLIQFSALTYGMWTVAVARPVHMVFEIDRFRVVHAIDVPPELLSKTPAGINALPLTGPTLLSVREFKDGNEKMEATMAALQGVSLSVRPDLWQPYESAIPEILKASNTIAVLKAKFPQRAADIDVVLAHANRDPRTLVYVPMIGRKSFWTIFLDSTTAEVVTTMPLDPY